MPLSYAIRNGHTAVAQQLLKAGASPDVANHKGVTALHSAAAGSVDALRMLVGALAFVNAQDEDGDTPLHFAAALDAADAIDILIDEYAEIEARNHTEQTPLFLAARSGKLHALDALIRRKADTRTVDTTGVSAAQAASNGGESDAVQRLRLAGAEAPAPMPPLHGRVTFLQWEPLRPAEVVAFLRQAGEPAGVYGTEGPQAANLPFYEATRLVEAISKPGDAGQAYLWSADRGICRALDGTNAPFYESNKRLHLTLTADTVVLYVQVFFYFTRSSLGWFNILVPGVAIPWLNGANPADRQEIEALVVPPNLLPDGLLGLSVNVLFENRVFRTQCWVACRDGKFAIPGGDIREMVAGQIKFQGDDLLRPNLPVRQDTAV